jgi:L-ascorbate metabolism protein UlaG (beta-lactamase superfamily)
MIQPVLSGLRLIGDIEQAAAPRATLWWLGQSGFVIKYRSTILYIDPYLSDSLTLKYANTSQPHIRITAAPISGEMVRHATAVFSTHKHSDHLDPGTVPAILAASPQAVLVLPAALAGHAHAMGITLSRMVPTGAGRSHRFGEIVVHVLPSAHEALDYSPGSGHPYLGFVFQCGEDTLYHPGDCVPFDGQVELVRPYCPTVVLMPINGRDPARGVAGNFTISEAAQFAADAGARWLIPMHYDMFTFNTVDVRRFVRHMDSTHPGRRYKVFQCGEGWMIPEE